MGFLDELRNKVQKAQGRIKQKTGRKTGDRSMEAEGRKDTISGGAKQAGEKVKDAAKEARRTFER